MKEKNLIIACFLTLASYAQQKVSSVYIKPQNDYDLSIIQVYPDSFPKVSVVFQAKNKLGKPLWELNKSELKVQEDDLNCEVIRVFNISTNKPVNIGLVLDRSGSMVDNPAQMPEGVETMQEVYFAGKLPKDYTMAITYAKDGVIEFLNKTQSSNDSILLISFSSEVDKILPLTNNFASVIETVKSIEPNGGTAFYDALYTAVDKLAEHQTKSVIVALTDGLDNESRRSYKEVIQHANKNNISIYIIGLGNAYETPLKELTENTDGFYYYTNDAQQLGEIYRNIKDQIKSIYQVDYTSASIDPLDKEKDIVFLFANDTLAFSDPGTHFTLPNDAIAYLKKQEEARLKKVKDEELLLAGSIGAVLVIGVGSFVLYRRSKKNRIYIVGVNPNPFQTDLILNYSIPIHFLTGSLNIYNVKGVIVKSIPLNASEESQSIDLNELSKGIYVFSISGGTSISNSQKVIKV